MDPSQAHLDTIPKHSDSKPVDSETNDSNAAPPWDNQVPTSVTLPTCMVAAQNDWPECSVLVPQDLDVPSHKCGFSHSINENCPVLDVDIVVDASGIAQTRDCRERSFSRTIAVPQSQLGGGISSVLGQITCPQCARSYLPQGQPVCDDSGVRYCSQPCRRAQHPEEQVRFHCLMKVWRTWHDCIV
jgi:hypothetical protein